MATSNGINGSAQDSINELLQADAKGHAPVHTFDPDASPSEKAAAAGKARDQLKSVTDSKKDDIVKGWNILPILSVSWQQHPSEVPVDTGVAVPHITVENADQEKEHVEVKEVKEVKAVEENAPSPPGAITAQPHVIPDWYRVGWRSVAGISDTPHEPGEARDKGVLDLFLNEQLYGDWYHNAALIVFVREGSLQK
jgi:hypothetical protein